MKKYPALVTKKQMRESQRQVVRKKVALDVCDAVAFAPGPDVPDLSGFRFLGEAFGNIGK